MEETTIIVGGGLAGLAAASALSARGIRVTLLESRSRLGGRATSVRDRVIGMTIDNCQHVAMGCCTNYLNFCRNTGIDCWLQRERELYFVGPTGEDGRAAMSRFRASPLPAPLHLFPSFLCSRLLSWRDKWAIGHALRRLARSNSEHGGQQSFSEWLDRQGQTTGAVDRFWKIVFVSALSESFDRISVSCARKVLVDGFLAHPNGWDVWIPTVPLETLYGDRVTAWLTSRNATVRLGSRVRKLVPGASGIQAVELSDGEQLSADHYILAVPHYAVPEILSPEPLMSRLFEDIEQIENAPITSVHLWFDRPISSQPHAVLTNRLSQWMFNHQSVESHGVRAEASRSTTENYYQVVISASQEIVGQDQQTVINQVVSELGSIWPEAAAARLLHARVITDRRAVFSPKPGVDQLRPTQQTPIPNLQLAGDWTQTGWPSTMEGAVRSGYLAAENILAAIGCPEDVRQPDLPVAALARILMGIR